MYRIVFEIQKIKGMKRFVFFVLMHMKKNRYLLGSMKSNNPREI